MKRLESIEACLNEEVQRTGERFDNLEHRLQILVCLLESGLEMDLAMCKPELETVPASLAGLPPAMAQHPRGQLGDPRYG